MKKNINNLKFKNNSNNKKGYKKWWNSEQNKKKLNLKMNFFKNKSLKKLKNKQIQISISIWTKKNLNHKFLFNLSNQESTN